MEKSKRTSDDGGGDEPARITEFEIVNNPMGWEAETGYVRPLIWCPHIEEVVQSVGPSGLAEQVKCADCDEEYEVWLCLHCLAIKCGRFRGQHMLAHVNENNRHKIALSLADLSVWCYDCDSYVHHTATWPVRNQIHQSRFGSALPH